MRWMTFTLCASALLLFPTTALASEHVLEAPEKVEASGRGSVIGVVSVTFGTGGGSFNSLKLENVENVSDGFAIYEFCSHDRQEGQVAVSFFVTSLLDRRLPGRFRVNVSICTSDSVETLTAEVAVDPPAVSLEESNLGRLKARFGS